MKQAKMELERIKGLIGVILKTDSKYIKRDFYKAYKRAMKDLREYCKYKQINYIDLTKDLPDVNI